MILFQNNCIVGDTNNDHSSVPDGWYYTVRELAEKLDIPESTIRVMKKRGELRCFSYYGRTYIDSKSVTERFNKCVFCDKNEA